MNQDTTNSAAASGATFPQRPPRTSPRVEPRFPTEAKTYAPGSGHGKTHNGAHNRSSSDDKPKTEEGEFLRRESEQAKTAMSKAMADAARDVGRAVDPRAWTAQHPWIAVATAAVGGFVAATQFVPSKDEQLLKKLEKIREAVMPEIERPSKKEREAAAVAEQLDGDGKPKKDRRGLLNVIGTELIKYLAPALSSALSAAIAGKSVANSAEEAQQPGVQDAGTQDPAATI